MNKTLIDNSENLKMIDALKQCISTPKTNTIRIATGFWDIPGTALIIDELTTFLEKKNAKLRLLIDAVKQCFFIMKQYSRINSAVRALSSSFCQIFKSFLIWIDKKFKFY